MTLEQLIASTVHTANHSMRCLFNNKSQYPYYAAYYLIIVETLSRIFSGMENNVFAYLNI